LDRGTSLDGRKIEEFTTREREEVAEKLKVTLKKSLIGRIPKHRRTVKALGLRKINQVVWHDDNPVIRGMIKEVEYLLEVERASLNIEKEKRNE